MMGAGAAADGSGRHPALWCGGGGGGPTGQQNAAPSTPVPGPCG